jgi:hypothetical protein
VVPGTLTLIDVGKPLMAGNEVAPAPVPDQRLDKAVPRQHLFEPLAGVLGSGARAASLPCGLFPA